MGDPEILKVKIGQRVVGHAATWKGAELLTNMVLQARGTRVPSWDETNTRETDKAFVFTVHK